MESSELFDHGVNRLIRRIPLSVLVPMIIIFLLGILNLSSAARGTRPDLYLTHVFRFAFAFSLLSITAVVHTRIIRRLAFLTFTVSIILLLMVLVAGTTAKGAARWVVLGPFRLQPSDPAKIALILALARYCSLYWPKDGYVLRSLIRPFNLSRPLGFISTMVLMLLKAKPGSIIADKLLGNPLGMLLLLVLIIGGGLWLFLSVIMLYHDRFKFESIVAPIDIPLLPFALIVVEPDLGTSLIILAIAAIMFLYVGIRAWSLLLGFLATLFIGILAYFTLLMDYQRQRIITFLNPNADIHGQGYHAMQSIIAIGSGRALGKGFNGGTQTQLSFLPENSTDFVFSVWAEEWGFIACVFLLGMYLFLLWSILRLALKVDDRFSQLVCVGVAANIFLHVLINVGMVTGLMPIVGVPLVLMSYGGSSLTVTLVGIGFVFNVALWRGQR